MIIPKARYFSNRKLLLPDRFIEFKIKIGFII